LDGAITGDPVAARQADGRIEVFARGNDGALWHIGQVEPNGSWGAWASLGGVIESDPVVAHNADGALEVFARGADEAVYHLAQIERNAGWGIWAKLGRP